MCCLVHDKVRGLKRKRGIFTVVESVDNWFTAYEGGENSVEVDEVVVGHVDINHEVTTNPQATGPEPQIVPVRSQGVEGSTNQLGVGCRSATQFPRTAEPGHSRGIRTSLGAGGYVAKMGPSRSNVSPTTSADGHVGTGGIGLTETNLAYEADLWLEAGTRATPNSVEAQHSESPGTLGLEARGHEWTDPTHQAFWALLKDAGYEEL